MGARWEKEEAEKKSASGVVEIGQECENSYERGEEGLEGSREGSKGDLAFRPFWGSRRTREGEDEGSQRPSNY